MISLVNWVKKSLNTKIFLATFSMLMLIGVVIYGSVLIAMPNTYQTVVDRNLENKLNELQEKLEATTFNEGKNIISEFMNENYVDAVMVDGVNNVVYSKYISSQVSLTADLPSMGPLRDAGKVTETEEAKENGKTKEVKTVKTIVKEVSQVTSNVEPSDYMSYTFKMNLPEDGKDAKEIPFVVNIDQFGDNSELSIPVNFEDSPETYRITLFNDHVVVKQASEILFQIAPFIIGVLFMISFIVALLFSRFITKPIKAVSRVAERMATLDLHCEETKERSDEIGILNASLNQMAIKLDNTLEELGAANRRLEADIQKEREMEQKRRDFFAAVSHELKTPLTIIKGQLEGMIYHAGKYKDRDTYLKESLVVADQMEEMVQEILSISRLESSKFKLERKPISLSLLVSECIELEKELAENKGIEVVCKIDPLSRDEDEILVDQGLIRRVLTNILSNGIHHSPKGERLLILLSKQEQNITLRVENTGVHINEEEIPKLFDAFYRVDRSRNRHTGGTGLGLYIVKLILDMHGLDFEMKNTKEGVQFKINFTQNTN